MSMRNALLALCLCLPVLVSCGDRSSPMGEADSNADAGAAPGDDAAASAPAAPRAADPEAGPGAQSPTPMPTPTPTPAAEGSSIALQPVGGEQLQAASVPGELGCNFDALDGATLLVARADVRPDGPVSGLVNNAGNLATLRSGQAGGFNDLIDGITLSGGGVTLELQRGEQRPTGNESSRHAAVLLVRHGDGAELGYEGTWTCGP